MREPSRAEAPSSVLGLSGTALAITESVITFIVAVVTIAFMTFFMLLEGPRWMERFYGLLPESSQEKWRGIGRDIYRTVGGYVTGNLLISVIAGVSSTIVLLILDVPYAVALGLLVAILDLIPLAGATLAAIILTAVAFLTSVPAGIIVLVFMIVYQQVENHLLQPLVYSRTVQLSPLAILISVLIGAKIAGILGALAAIPVAGRSRCCSWPGSAPAANAVRARPPPFRRSERSLGGVDAHRAAPAAELGPTFAAGRAGKVKRHGHLDHRADRDRRDRRARRPAVRRPPRPRAEARGPSRRRPTSFGAARTSRRRRPSSAKRRRRSRPTAHAASAKRPKRERSARTSSTPTSTRKPAVAHAPPGV